MRTYERTHPWINFHIDLRRAPAELWVMLGECQSKCEHLAKVPLRPETAEELYQVYLAKGLHATAAIEGNTLSEEQVRDLISDKLEVPPSQEYLKQEVENILNECNHLHEEISAGEEPVLTSAGIRRFNRGVLTNLELEPGVVPGEIRDYEVVVGRYKGAPAQDCAYLLDRLCDWLGSDTFHAPSGLGIVYAIIRAVLAHLFLAWIHPFGDGNGRTARLAELQILMSSQVPAPAAQLLSNHYNQTRTEYYRQLNRASGPNGDMIPFLRYAVQGLRDGLREQLENVFYQTWDVAWENYVYQHSAFRDKASVTAKRRCRLILDLWKEVDPVPLKALADISPRVTRLYAKKTTKTLVRDVNELEKIGLLEKSPRGCRARGEIILAFLPVRAKEPDA